MLTTHNRGWNEGANYSCSGAYLRHHWLFTYFMMHSTSASGAMASARGTRLVQMLRSVRAVPFQSAARSSSSVTPQSASSSSGSSLAHQLQFQNLFSSNVLAGRNIFQLRATAAAVDAVAQTAAAPEIIELPTSDESDKLLRIRHSVRESCLISNCCILWSPKHTICLWVLQSMM